MCHISNSPVAMFYVTSLKYGYVFNCNSRIRNSYQNSRLSPSGIALILLSIWLQSLALHCSLLLKFKCHVTDFQNFGLSITEETYFVEMRIWCIKIGTVYDLYILKSK